MPLRVYLPVMWGATAASVEIQGIEPRPTVCKTVALPLSYTPICSCVVAGVGFEPTTSRL